MHKIIGRSLAISAVLLVAACQYEPFGPPYYYRAQPMPPPLQPYVAPIAPAPVVRVPHRVRRHHHHVKRRHHRRPVHCPCVPAR